jgi:ATP-dependent helicase/nuclease subunit B
MTQIQFILGRSGTGKTAWCVNAAAAALCADTPSPLVLLVPEQATYQMEAAVLARPQVAGYSRLRVLSFNRLVFWLNKRQRSGAELSRLGRRMAAHRVLLEQADSLVLYRDAARHSGLAERLSGLLTELQQADCTPQQVRTLAEQLAAKDPASATTRKWQDIAKIFAGYAAFFETASADLHNSEAQLTLARRDIAKAAFLKGARIWVDGFSGFTVQERELLIELARHAETMHIALCLDPATHDLENADPDALDPAGLFYCTEQTYAELLGIFRKCKFSILPPRVLDQPHRYARASALGHIGAYLLDEHAPTATAQAAVEIACCTDARAEAEWVAGRICELVHQKGYRYRHIAVALPEMDAYAAYIESAFKRCGIPYFLDRPAAIRHHPLAETLQAALAAAEHFATADVLCCLKSGLTGVPPDQIDRLERYCLTYGIERDDWTNADPWQFAQATDSDEDAAMETLRQRVAAPLKELHAAIFARPDALDAGAFVRAVWHLLEHIQARTTLAAWAENDPADTHGHRQTWTQLSSTMDELERVFAGRTERAEVFVSTLADALSSLTIKLIPPTLDQTLVGSIERSRHPEIRAMFLVGATQKQFPTPLSTTDVLGRRERESARAAGLELPDTLSQQLTKRQYLAYIALTRASDYLAISFPQQDEKGAALAPSVWVERLEALFTDVRPTAAGRRQSVWHSRNTTELAERLAAACGKDRSPQAQTDAAAYVLHAGLKSASEALRTAAGHVLNALQYTNTAELTAKDTLAKLERISDFSASRLGTFAACPYQHFAKYVLALERRPLLRFEPLDVGLFYHKVIEMLFGQLRQRGLSWGTTPAEELAALCETTIGRTLEQDAAIAAFMRRQRHHRVIVEAACDVLRRFVPALAELEQAGAFRQAGSEFEFRFELDKGLFLRGRIDRLDIADIAGKKTAAIFDFKRTERSPNWTKFYHGLDVQLLMYLLAIPSLPKELGAETIAGAFYLPIELSGKTLSPDQIKDKRGTFGYKAKGLFNGDFAAALDAGAAGRSRYYNFAADKEGRPYSYYGSSGAVRPEDFDAVLTCARRKIARLAADIRSAAIPAAPCRIGKSSPCAHCDYQSVCRFDWQINDYNSLESYNKEQALEKMKSLNH